MTQEELLKRLLLSTDSSLDAALNAVVELHKQLVKDDGTNRCEVCWTAYPCSTAKVIGEHISAS